MIATRPCKRFLARTRNPAGQLVAAVSLCLLSAAGLGIAAGCAAGRKDPAAPQSTEAVPQPYATQTVRDEAEAFFGAGARGLADVLNRVFADKGPPDAYIKGEEGGGAFGLGLRYGHGTVYFKDGTSSNVYWRGPSLGLDLGGSAAQAFVLIYGLDDLDALFGRFGGIEGSLYYVGGVGVTYNKRENIVLAPVRLGVGWRQGVSVGYLRLSPERSWLPF